MHVLNRIKAGINSIEFLMYLLAISLSTLLLGYAASGVVLGVFVVFSVRYALINKIKIQVDYALIIPIILYLLFIASLSWSVDKSQTLKGLERTVALILVPLVFLVLPKIALKDYRIVLKFFTIFNVFLGIFFLITAAFNFIKTKSLSALTYHELVSVFELSAIYVAIIFSVSLFYLLSLKKRTARQNGMLIFFLVFVFLLSSKTILFVLCIAAVLYLLRQKAALINKKKIAILTILALIIVGISSITLYERFLFEKQSKFSEVLEKETFGKVYYWTGSSIRLMQLRILKEQLEEESIIFNGFGLFASRKNLDERHEKFDTYFKFHHYNYHNQYAQMLSELGIFGLLLLLMMLISIWLRALKTKNFFFLMFGIMMTFIFFTESVLWRQRGLFLFIIIYALIMSVSSKEKHLAS